MDAHKYAVWFSGTDPMNREPRDRENLTLPEAIDHIAANLRAGEIGLIDDGFDNVYLRRSQGGRIMILTKAGK